MIDAGTTMVLIGTAIQALPPASAIVQLIRRRPDAAELARALPAMPLPPRDRVLEELAERAGAALDDG